MHREREAREAVARELQEVQAEKADWDSTIQCLQAVRSPLLIVLLASSPQPRTPQPLNPRLET
eukprot:1474951-Rhodomonas_salina.1